MPVDLVATCFWCGAHTPLAENKGRGAGRPISIGSGPRPVPPADDSFLCAQPARCQPLPCLLVAHPSRPSSSASSPADLTWVWGLHPESMLRTASSPSNVCRCQVGDETLCVRRVQGYRSLGWCGAALQPSACGSALHPGESPLKLGLPCALLRSVWGGGGGGAQVRWAPLGGPVGGVLAPEASAL